jgi:hypothetical protein
MESIGIRERRNTDIPVKFSRVFILSNYTSYIEYEIERILSKSHGHLNMYSNKSSVHVNRFTLPHFITVAC